MKKKIVVMALIMTFVLMLTGCHKHTWKEATCTEPKTCTECGETEGETLEHKWEEATCMEPKTCTVCGETKGEALGHKWEEATCMEPKTCTVCGKTEGEALGHDAKPTCKEDAICSVCGETVKALGHNWKEATCTEPKTCAECGKTKGKPLGHTTDNGICERCGEEISAPQEYAGTGDDVVLDVNIPDSGIYRAHITHDGSRNIIIKAYDSTGDYDLLVNSIGNYDGYVLLLGKSPLSFNIEADGNWSISIEKCGQTDSTSFSGNGDFVTDIFRAESGAWTFNYEGESNFIVKIYTTDGRDLLVNTIGSYSGTQIVTIPSGSGALFEIKSEGAWVIEKV